MRAVFRLTLLIFASILAPALRAESAASLPAPTGYIDDYANVLSGPAKSEFEALCVEVHDKTKAQVFVVTVDTLGGTTIDQFANDLFHRWKIGEKKTDRGVLLIFAVKDHKWRIEVGYGLESILNDAKVGDIGRDMVPDLHAGRWDDGVRTGLDFVAQVIADDAKVQLDSLQSESPSTETTPQPIAAPVDSPTDLRAWFAPALFFVIWILAFAFIVVHVIRRKGSGGGSSGFWGSDSSSSSSDSSDSFSGGDGGDSGGGGASGDF